jgi:putative PIN family toxin of toxin-antitoxin system
MNETPPGAVFDCTVFLQALVNRKGPAFACKQLVDDGQVVLFLSQQVLAEVTEVLNRPELHQKLPALTAERVQAFLADLAARATTVADVPLQFSYPRDPKDEPYLNLALAAGARYLVAWDKDLLDLMNEHTPDGKDFRQRFPALTILTPVSFLREFSPSQGGNPQPEGAPG